MQITILILSLSRVEVVQVHLPVAILPMLILLESPAAIQTLPVPVSVAILKSTITAVMKVMPVQSFGLTLWFKATRAMGLKRAPTWTIIQGLESPAVLAIFVCKIC
jgi:hypothetical protein